ncbi:MAG: histidine kinase [Bacilli bacterium]|nr:histidine kinase [Bacilli bacterium]
MSMDTKRLDNILKKMTEVVEKSQEEILLISEQAEKEYAALEEELVQTKLLVNQYIAKSNELEKKVRASRRQLSEVSKRFDIHSEETIRRVYEKTHQLQTEYAVVQREEKALRQKRDDLERRLIQLSKTIERANNLGRKVSIISSFLQDDFHEVNELVKSAQEKQQIGLKIIEAQEKERKRISREIHDGPAQSLANILIRSEIVDLAFRDGDTEQALTEMKSIRESIRQALREVRRIIYDLRPMALDDLGLFPTIKKHISSISEYNNIDIDLALHGDERRLDPHYEVAVFRIIQEGLQNAIKHAKASRIIVRLEIRDNLIALNIEDDGIGFDPENINKKDSYGLIGMKERVDLLDGELTIKSEPNRGTKIVVKLPYKIPVESERNV